MEMDSSARRELDISEYFVFAGLLLASCIIGVFFAYKDRRDNSTKNYYFAGQKMNPVAVGMSVSVTYLSSFTMIGVPAEVYLVGTAFFWPMVVISIITFCTRIYYLPLYYRNNFKSIYEYLDVRFGPITRRISSFMITVSATVRMSASIFVPSLALSAVTPIDLNWSIAFTSIICTFYTTLGGMKAVIWTDVLQTGMMLIGVFSFFICGMIEIGGFQQFSGAMARGHRNTFWKIFEDFDMSSRATPLATALGALSVFMNNLTFSQSAMQRFLSCRNERLAKMSLVAYLVPTLLIVLFAVCNGLVMYAFFEGCDPLLAGQLQKPDQKIPYMALEVFRNHLGLTGLFVAAVYSGCLSTVSSGLNSFSIVILEEVFVAKWPNMSDSKRVLVGKVLAVVLGVVVMTVAYLLSLGTGNIFKMLLSMLGIVSGPVMGLFFLGMFYPWANYVGSVVGVAISSILLIWMFFGHFFLRTFIPKHAHLPLSTDQCPVSVNTTTMQTNLTSEASTAFSEALLVTQPETSRTFDQLLYNINFNYYGALGILFTVVFGLIASFIAGANSPADANPELFIPMFNNPRLPAKVRKFFRFGVPERMDRTDLELEMLDESKIDGKGKLKDSRDE